MNPRFLDLLFCWLQEAFLPMDHGSPALPTVPDSKTAFTPPSKSKNFRYPTEERKAIPAILQVTPETLFPQGTQKPSTSHCTSLQESHFSPVQELESQVIH
jgi:hypothetical protein